MDSGSDKSNCAADQVSPSVEKNSPLQEALGKASAAHAQKVIIDIGLLMELADSMRRLIESSSSSHLDVELAYPPHISRLPKNKEFISRQELAEILNLPVQTLASWAYTGKPALPFVRLGKLVRYRVSDVEQFIEDNTSTM